MIKDEDEDEDEDKDKDNERYACDACKWTT